LFSIRPLLNIIRGVFTTNPTRVQRNFAVKIVNEFVKRRIAGETEKYESIEHNMTQDFCWSNDLPLNASHSHLQVNLLNF